MAVRSGALRDAVALFVVSLSVAVFLAWAGFAPLWLTSIAEGAVTQKASTSSCLILVGIAMICVTRRISDSWASAGFLCVILAALQSIGMLLNRSIFGLEKVAGEWTIAADIASKGTGASLLALSAGVALALYEGPSRATKRLALVPIVLGGVGLLGHLLAIPILYYWVPGWSTGMAVHTSGELVVLGLLLRFATVALPEEEIECLGRQE